LKSHFILYVSDQKASTKFYEKVLDQTPSLNVPGMTEFSLSETSVLDLMPSAGIVRLLGNKVEDPAKTKDIPRAELYIIVENPGEYFKRALSNGARELSALSIRDWGMKQHVARTQMDMF
jgi:hypothetical protein